MNFMHEQWKADEAARLAASEPRNPHAKGRIEAAAQSGAIERRTQNAAQAVEWLNNVGVKILAVEIDRLGALVKVQFSPFLCRLFANDCAWNKRRQQGELTIYTWFAVRFGARIVWEEIQCPRS